MYHNYTQVIVKNFPEMHSMEIVLGVEFLKKLIVIAINQFCQDVVFSVIKNK